MKSERKEISLKWKLFASFALFTGLTLLLLWVFQVVLLDSFYKTIKTWEVKSSARVIEQNLNLPQDELQTLVTRLSQNKDMCITVYDTKEAAKLADSDVLIGCMIHKIIPYERYRLYRTAVENGGEYLHLYQQHFFRDDSYESRDYAGDVPLRDSGLYDSLLYIRMTQNEEGHSVALILNVAITPIDSTVQTLQTQLLIVSSILLLLSALIAFLLSRSIARPIDRLNKSAKSLATGHYDTVFEAGGYREINELAQSLTQAQSELSRVDEYRRELIANVSHDMRTPLTLICGYAEAMRDFPPENNQENLDIILSEAKRLTDLVNDMLEQTKYEDGLMHAQSERFDLSATMDEIVRRYRGFTENDGYRISASIDRNLMVYADPVKISQAICNLINNALHYCGDNREIEISARRCGEKARVCVRDHGPGIPADRLPFIWDRYYKVDTDHQRSSRGSGLGLSIVKKIMQLHKAPFGVDSREGKGSTFWFELELAEKEPHR